MTLDQAKCWERKEKMTFGRGPMEVFPGEMVSCLLERGHQGQGKDSSLPFGPSFDCLNF